MYLSHNSQNPPIQYKAQLRFNTYEFNNKQSVSSSLAIALTDFAGEEAASNYIPERGFEGALEVADGV